MRRLCLCGPSFLHRPTSKMTGHCTKLCKMKYGIKLIQENGTFIFIFLFPSSFLFLLPSSLEAGMTAILVIRWRAGWPKNCGSIPGRGKRYYLLHIVQTGSGAYTASSSVGTRNCFPDGQEVGDMELTTHFHLVLSLRMVELYPQSPSHLYGQVLN
jgi:hypothetical protein